MEINKWFGVYRGAINCALVRVSPPGERAQFIASLQVDVPLILLILIMSGRQM